jgi:hypothetical protein
MTALYVNQLPTVTALLSGDLMLFSRDGFAVRKITLDNLFTAVPIPVSLASTLAVSGASRFAAGTEALPAITPIGDTDTGIWFPAANTMAIATNATNRIYFGSAGEVGIGAIPLPEQVLSLGRNITGATTAYGFAITSQVLSGVTSRAVFVETRGSVQNSVWTLPDLRHFSAVYPGGTFGSATVTTQFGFYVANNLTGATNNYGFYGNLPAAANRYNLYMAGTADNYLAGALGIGGVVFAGCTFRLNKAITGGANSYAQYVDGAIQTDVTTCNLINTAPSQVVGGSLTALRHFFAEQGTLSGSATSQFGFATGSSMVSATNNYSFYGALGASANRWNFYAAGSANNAYAGNSSFGKVTAPIAAVDTNSIAIGFATNSGATCAVGSTDCTIIQTTQASVYTLPAAASYPNRILNLVTQFAGTVTSASSNVVPLAGGAAGTAILAATAGKYATLQSNGTNWVIIAAN